MIFFAFALIYIGWYPYTKPMVGYFDTPEECQKVLEQSKKYPNIVGAQCLTIEDFENPAVDFSWVDCQKMYNIEMQHNRCDVSVWPAGKFKNNEPYHWCMSRPEWKERCGK